MAVTWPMDIARRASRVPIYQYKKDLIDLFELSKRDRSCCDYFLNKRTTNEEYEIENSLLIQIGNLRY